MKNWHQTIDTLLTHDFHVAIISGGLQKTARDIAAHFPSELQWRKRWGGIDRHTSKGHLDGCDTRLHVFTNGWLIDTDDGKGNQEINDFGRYQVQMNGKGAIVRMLQRRLGIPKSKTASIGDSSGDIGMFEESGCAILFNRWNDEPIPFATHVVDEKDLDIVGEVSDSQLTDREKFDFDQGINGLL